MRPFLQPQLRGISASARVRPVTQFFPLPSVFGVAGSSRGAVTPLRRHLSADTTAAPPLRPLRHRMYDDFQEWWRRRVLFLRIAGGTAAVALVLAVYWARAHGPPLLRKGILDAFVAGSVPREWDADDALADVPRPELHAALAHLLRPAATKTYAVIVGEHGSGKSTAVRKAARASSDGPNGVVFIEINEVRKFSLDLASCLNLAVPEIDWVGAGRRRLEGTTKDEKGVSFADEPLATWLALCDTLKEAAADFRGKYKRPMTLVIDGVHKLVKEDPKFLDKLQDFAKTAADTGNLNVVFVSSDKTALAHMKGRSSWSRASTSLEVGDIPDDAATTFLEHRFELDRARAAELVHDVTGGRFSLLLDPSVAVKSVAAIRHEKYNETGTQLLRVGLEPSHAFFQALVKNTSVDAYAAFKLLGGDAKIEALLAANIIAAHVDGTYTAHSRYVATFLEMAQSAPGVKY